ncbi:hypothetical protein HAX54_003435, partial [Datura stramonium]|nr:hypothetical protein [Datura stramonium]
MDQLTNIDNSLSKLFGCLSVCSDFTTTFEKFSQQGIVDVGQGVAVDGQSLKEPAQLEWPLGYLNFW